MMIKGEIRNPIKSFSQKSIFVSFTFSYDILDKIKSLPIRYYNADSKEWEIPYTLKNKLIELFPDIELINDNQYSTPKIKYYYDFKLKPLDYQLDAIDYGLVHNSFLLGDEMGLGKTKVAIDLACIRKVKNEVKRVLVVCGVNSLKYNWVEEIKKQSNEKCWILGWKKKRNGKYKIGSSTDKLNDLINLDESYLFAITNIESFRNPNFTIEVKKQCEKNKIDMIIFDEAHCCKNPSAIQTKGLLKCKAKYNVAMSGTFILNKPLDLFVPLKWTGYYSNSYYFFKNTFTVVDCWNNIIGFKNTDILRNMLNDCMIRRTKEEVKLSLPEKTYINELIEMTPNQEEIYDSVILNLRENIDKIKLSKNPLMEMLRARQATGWTGLLSSTIKESAKMDRLVELVDEIQQNGKKCLVFSNWAEMIEIAKEKLSEFSPAIYTGQYDELFLEQEKSRFKTDDKCKVICGTIGKMGTGLTLTEANYVIFLDEPWSMAIKDQASDRVHRIGQINPVTIITLICKNTMDEKVSQLIEKKGAMTDFLIDGKVDNIGKLVDWLLYD